MNLTRNVILGATMMWLTAPVQAQFVGLDLGAENWPAQSSLLDTDDAAIEAAAESQPPTLILEHSIRLLPNIRFRGYSLDSSSAAELGAAVSFSGELYPEEESPRSSFDLNHDDLVFYYQLSNERIDLDLGVDLKRFDGEFSFDGSSSRTVGS